MKIAQAQIDTALELVRARHMEDVSLVAVADALSTAVSEASGTLDRMRGIPADSFGYPHAEMAGILVIAQAQVKVATLYDVLAVALQRLGETVQR